MPQERIKMMVVPGISQITTLAAPIAAPGPNFERSPESNMFNWHDRGEPMAHAK